MTKILPQIFLVALSFCATAQSGGHEHLGPAPLEADDSLFPTVGPILVSVSMLATIKSDGRVSQTKVLDTIRGTNDFYQGTLIGYLDDAVAAATRWRFDPAIDSGLRPIESLASITFLYDRVWGRGTALPTFTTVPSKTGDYVPPIPTKLSRAEYPVNSIGIGTVVLNLHVEANGSVSDARIIKSVPSLDEPSIIAAKKWRFQAAQYKGTSIPSTATAAFVYLPFMRRH